jgi:hypothetical protein
MTFFLLSVPIHAMETLHDLSTRWGEWSASRLSRALPSRGKDSQYPLDRRLGGHARAGLDIKARGKILSPLPGIEPLSPGHPVCSQTL